MSTIEELLKNNAEWSEKAKVRYPDFFLELAQGQKPKFLWIGCSDSRIQPNLITGLKPGELFVHRNIANMALPDDVNTQSVIQYAVEQLKVEHIIVCGHYHCGGILSCKNNTFTGDLGKWINKLNESFKKYDLDIPDCEHEETRLNLLSEINAIEQVKNISKTLPVTKAWSNNQKLDIHAWIYDIGTTTIRDLNFTLTSSSDIEKEFKNSLDELIERTNKKL